MAIVMIYVSDPVLQIGFLMASTILTIIFYLSTFPFKSKRLSYLEVFNEGIILVNCYCQLLFTDIEPNGVPERKIGVFIIVLNLAMIIANLVVIIYAIMKPLYLRLRKLIKRDNSQKIYCE